MNIYSSATRGANTRGGIFILAKMKRWATIATSLMLFVVLQFIGSQTGITLLTRLERQKKWLLPALIVTTAVFISLWFSLLKRPFSSEFWGMQLVGITAVSSVIVVGYRAVPAATMPETLHRVKWLLVLGTLQGLRAIQKLTHKANRPLVLKGLAASVLICLAIWYRQPLMNAAALIQDQDAVIGYLNQFGPLAPVLLSVALVAQVFVAAIPGHMLILGGGYVYGFWAILALSVVTTVGASQIAFLLAKWAGQPVVERLAPRQVLDKWNDSAATNGMVFFMFAFMLPIFPADIMNYVAGLSPISGRRFLVANFFGRLPGLILLCVLGANGLALTPQLLAVVTAVGLLMFASWYYLFVHSKRDGS
ncbi:MAG: TVP38/TMEM64 family protein [Anaerolineae bacterium]|nr:TVP38/TMEM64 family protein [Anaerolineae bacterium]